MQKRLKNYITDDVTVLNVGNIRMNLNSRQCHLDNKEIMLTPKQFDILKLLIENKSQVVSRQEFMTEIWGHSEVTPRNVDSQINYLKKKMEGFLGHIKSVPGFGYRLDSNS